MTVFYIVMIVFWSFFLWEAYNVENKTEHIRQMRIKIVKEHGDVLPKYLEEHNSFLYSKNLARVMIALSLVLLIMKS